MNRIGEMILWGMWRRRQFHLRLSFAAWFSYEGGESGLWWNWENISVRTGLRDLWSVEVIQVWSLFWFVWATTRIEYWAEMLVQRNGCRRIIWWDAGYRRIESTAKTRIEGWTNQTKLKTLQAWLHRVFNGLRQLVSDIDSYLIRWMPQRKIFCGNRDFRVWLWAFYRWPM